jgi:hypothetical protein
MRTPPKITKKPDLFERATPVRDAYFFERALPVRDAYFFERALPVRGPAPVKIGPFIWGRIFLGRCEIKIILGSRKKIEQYYASNRRK